MRRQANRLILRAVCFIGILLLLFGAMTAVFSNHPDFRIFQSIRGFYEEPADSLQAVYIGSSNCYAFWNSLVAWKNYGLTIFPYTCSQMPFEAVEYIMREVRKTQPNAMFIVNVNSMDFDDLCDTYIHHILCDMPPSENKTALKNHLCDVLGMSWSERLQFDFSWITMRQYWTQYLDRGLIPRVDGMKAASHYDGYLTKFFNNKRRYRQSETRAPITENQRTHLDRLMDFCEAEGIRVLFVVVPRGERTLDALGRINTACDVIRERGHKLLYLTDQVDAMHIDLGRDFYDLKHTNVHGSIKFTNYLSQYLVSEFGLEDRRGDPAYESWAEGWERYWPIIAPYVLDIELDTAKRDFSLAAPTGVKLTQAEDGAVQLRWKPVKGADGYCVYAKAGESGPWQRVCVAEACEYVDATCQPGTEYHYTVVPVSGSGDAMRYGVFSPAGQSITL